MDKIEHLGIAVPNLAESKALFVQLMGSPAYKEETVESDGVRTSFFQAGPNKLELLEGTRPDSPISKFIEKKGPGIHHIAFAVTDIEAHVTRLLNEGFRVLNESPKKGADGKKVVFLHPKDSNGVLVELCEDM